MTPPSENEEQVHHAPVKTPVPTPRILLVTLVVVVGLFALLAGLGFAGYLFYRAMGPQPSNKATQEQEVKGLEP